MALPYTVDQNELSYYERLADEWWDENGKFWPLHRLNRLREVYLNKQICQHFDRNINADAPLEGLSAIDIGCGGGILSESKARLGATVTGIDVVAKSLHVARQHSLSQGLSIEYLECTAEKLAGLERQFDIVLNMEVVEHVVELPTFIDSCAQLLKPDGITFIATINRNLLSWLFAIVGAEHILRWLPRCLGMPENVKPVIDFEPGRYLGQWYEIARLDHSFEQGLEQVTAEYSMREDGGITVVNRGFSTEDKEWKEAIGKAYFVNNTDEGYLKVSFFGPFYGSYVVFELDSENYQYAFVSGPDLSYLWLLSRTPVISDEVLADFIKKSESLGFETSKLIMVNQIKN